MSSLPKEAFYGDPPRAFCVGRDRTDRSGRLPIGWQQQSGVLEIQSVEQQDGSHLEAPVSTEAVVASPQPGRCQNRDGQWTYGQFDEQGFDKVPRRPNEFYGAGQSSNQPSDWNDCFLRGGTRGFSTRGSGSDAQCDGPGRKPTTRLLFRPDYSQTGKWRFRQWRFGQYLGFISVVGYDRRQQRCSAGLGLPIRREGLHIVTDELRVFPGGQPEHRWRDNPSLRDGGGSKHAIIPFDRPRL